MVKASSEGMAAEPGSPQTGSEGVHATLPLFPRFRSKILPILVAYWIIGVALASASGSGMPLVIAGWLTPTTIMLWPVGRGSGLRYTEYRSPWFIGSVASMAGVPITVYLLISTPMSDAWAKHFLIAFLIAVVIGLFGVETAHTRAFGKPVKMFFRPDLILGNNRILAGGLAAMAIGMKFMFTDAAPGDVPHGNWYAFFGIIALGLYQLIPLRGLTKMRMSLGRIINGRSSTGVTILKELWLIGGISLMLFFAHNFFGGVTPFTRNVLAGSTPGSLIMVASAALIILLRSAYKKRIGDPFIKETVAQSLVKDAILVVGMTAYFYGYIAVMVDHFPRTPNLGPNLPLTLIGLTLYVWGVLLLLPVRAWARQQAKKPVIEQMLSVVLPSLDPERRKAALRNMLSGLCTLPERQLERIVRLQFSALQQLSDALRGTLLASQMEALSELPEEARLRMMKTMDKVMMAT
ncbi:hypothetical protein B9Q06_09380 [Candidatus Marsarchaeota G2 archaeon ECH_B_2]|uniref:Uncharacterized protein n=3 Tax=Candidatus Marsarchaeota group 2 TaxID=2203771 RepID=A0A2R6B6R2_9ARCH|nr:MAG: hypothetical protein B9Q06_09380 [Candidatus Marsarchaeota G2 archaeon ECH_B_2]PSO01527.1 MAG: hypothetical protein B9Q05_08790 [Candidatus Marsarchaeota G2 archaeon ECH_B_1]